MHCQQNIKKDEIWGGPQSDKRIETMNSLKGQQIEGKYRGCREVKNTIPLYPSNFSVITGKATN
jgi:hypothetical protein